MRCSKCGHKLNREASFCTRCGQHITKPDFISADTGHSKSYKKTLFIGLSVLFCIIYLFGIRCNAGVCPLPKCIGGDYCTMHTCQKGECKNKVADGYTYCYTHARTYTPDYSYTPEVAENVLKFSDVSVSHNSSYTVCTGTVTNNGNRTYSFVEVKGKFKNASGTVLDTDWTYAVGSEGLAPGESATFRLSVDKNRDIKNCSMEIVDYDRD